LIVFYFSFFACIVNCMCLYLTQANQQEATDMIKFTCIDTQHADVAVKRLLAVSRDAMTAGRSVLADGEWDDEAIYIMSQSIAYTETPTEWDQSYLGGAK
jgi:hypothetical protein